MSLDGPKEDNDRFRRYIGGNGVYDTVIDNIEKLKKAKVDFNVLTVVTRQLAAHPKELMDFYVNNNIQYVQLIPCLPSLNDKNDTTSMFPAVYRSFFCDLFTYWKQAYMNGDIVHVNTFENLAFILNGFVPPSMRSDGCVFLIVCDRRKR